jgi:GTP-binding protein HflX
MFVSPTSRGAHIELHGNLAGLKPSLLKRLEALYRRRVPPSDVVSAELARVLCDLSAEASRQLGVLLDRRGHVAFVVVGDAHRIVLPDVGRARAGIGRFRGLRLVHTHLRGEALTKDDLTDLALLRLDMVAALAMDARAIPQRLHCAHLLPENPQGELWRVMDAMSPHQADIDFERFIRDLEDEFARRLPMREAKGRERALLVHIFIGPTPDAEERQAELLELARTANVAVVGAVVQRRGDADPRTLIGKGKLQDAVLRAMQLGAELLIFDQNLTPSQARNVADLTDIKVIDRTQLILDIFARRAQSRDGKLQVELAQLKYLFPRLAMKQEALSRLTGGIGGQGPGETTLEIHKRRARERITRLERELRDLARAREVRRRKRADRGVPIVAIVGYTNAGKSTLFNSLTNATVLAENKLFATLDPTSRRLRFPHERELVLSDTVGFIRDLPPDLVTAFRATLEELYDADLLIHVCDVADPYLESRIAAVERILADMELADVPRIAVYNKRDLLPEGDADRMAQRAGAVALSARDAQSTRGLLDLIEARLWQTTHDLGRKIVREELAERAAAGSHSGEGDEVAPIVSAAESAVRAGAAE